MVNGRQCRTCGGKWNLKDVSQCPFCRCNEYRKENEALKAERDRFREVLKYVAPTLVGAQRSKAYGALNHKE